MTKRQEKKLELQQQKEMEERIERQAKINSSIKKMEQTIKKYEAKQNELITLAARAKKEGRNSDYNNFLPVIQAYVAKTLKTKSMCDKLNIAKIMHDDADLTADFVDAMGILAEETSKMYDSSKLREVAQKFRQTNVQAEKSKQMFDYFMQEINNQFESLNAGDGGEIDAELQARIDEEMKSINSEIENRIDSRLDSLE